jgi:hypothetical protein
VGAQTGDREITAREKVRSVRIVHQKRTTKGERLATGDRVLTRQAIFNAGGKASGTLFTDCANVGKTAAVFKATLQCTLTYRFGDGQIVSAGVVRLGSSGVAAASRSLAAPARTRACAAKRRPVLPSRASTPSTSCASRTDAHHT